MFDTRSLLHDQSAMKNVTITLDEEVARWARIRFWMETSELGAQLRGVPYRG